MSSSFIPAGVLKTESHTQEINKIRGEFDLSNPHKSSSAAVTNSVGLVAIALLAAAGAAYLIAKSGGPSSDSHLFFGGVAAGAASIFPLVAAGRMAAKERVHSASLRSHNGTQERVQEAESRQPSLEEFYTELTDSKNTPQGIQRTIENLDEKQYVAAVGHFSEKLLKADRTKSPTTQEKAIIDAVAKKAASGTYESQFLPYFQNATQVPTFQYSEDALADAIQEGYYRVAAKLISGLEDFSVMNTGLGGFSNLPKIVAKVIADKLNAIPNPGDKAEQCEKIDGKFYPQIVEVLEVQDCEALAGKTENDILALALLPRIKNPTLICRLVGVCKSDASALAAISEKVYDEIKEPDSEIATILLQAPQSEEKLVESEQLWQLLDVCEDKATVVQNLRPKVLVLLLTSPQDLQELIPAAVQNNHFYALEKMPDLDGGLVSALKEAIPDDKNTPEWLEVKWMHHHAKRMNNDDVDGFAEIYAESSLAGRVAFKGHLEWNKFMAKQDLVKTMVQIDANDFKSTLVSENTSRAYFERLWDEFVRANEVEAIQGWTQVECTHLAANYVDAFFDPKEKIFKEERLPVWHVLFKSADQEELKKLVGEAGFRKLPKS